MTYIQVFEFEAALLEFTKRASKEGATAEEVEALPAVVETLAFLLKEYGTG